jgi:hypothetical protein
MSGEALAQLERDKRMLAGADPADLRSMFEPKKAEEPPVSTKASKAEEKRKKRFSFGKPKEEEENNTLGVYSNPYAE